MHVTIIAKTPVAGLVKTRLCPPCTPDQAAAIAAAGLADTIDAIDSLHVDARRTLLLDGDVQPWMPSSWAVAVQRGNGLAERLRNGFIDLGPGVVIGMETPHVAGLLAGAIDAVRMGRDVLGPAEDGGYWMIGLCAATARFAHEVFDGVPMSQSTTGSEQLARLQRWGGVVDLLPVARDLDDFDDLRAIATSGRTGRLAALARATVDALAA